MELTTREISTIIWFVPVAVVIWWKLPSIRDPIRAMFAIVLQPVILVPAALFTVWMLVGIYFAAQLSAWSFANLKDTLYWFIPGYILLFGAVNAAGEERFFRRRVRDAVGLSAFLAFYVNVATLDLAWELILVPLLTLLSLVIAVAGVKLGGKTAVTDRAGNRAGMIGGLIVIGLVVYTTVSVVQNARSTDWAGLVSALALPVWLTIWAFPFLLAISTYAEYDRALTHMRIATTDGRVPWRSVLALVVTFRFRRGALRRFAGRWPRDLVGATSFGEARAVIAEQQAAEKAEAERKQKAAEDLRKHAGAVGVDDHGRQLDKREFKETVAALNHLAASQMGWYRSRGHRYQLDLLEKFPDVFRGDLPADHGITMAVSNSGQSWYAWRRTPSGLYFGVGAAGRPPGQRFYEGMDPPQGFPKGTPGWLPPHERGPNWEWAYDPDDVWTEDEADEVGSGDADADPRL